MTDGKPEVGEAAMLSKIAESLAGIERQLSEIDSTLVGSLDDLIAGLRDLARSIDRLLGRAGK